MRFLVLPCHKPEHFNSISELLNEGWVIAQNGIINTESMVIYHLSLAENEDEANPEHKTEYTGVDSIKEVSHNDADPLLSQGYTIDKVYQKSTILVRRSVKIIEPHSRW